VVGAGASAAPPTSAILPLASRFSLLNVCVGDVVLDLPDVVHRRHPGGQLQLAVEPHFPVSLAGGEVGGIRVVHSGF
jgi:hypothetical protein